MAIIGLLAGLAVPVLNNFRPNYTASATAQLMDALARARQLAISQRTTVYMVFVPTNYWGDPGYARVLGNPAEAAKGDKLLDKQVIGYNFVSLRSLGDQPGRPSVRYLDSWRTLPEGAFIYPGKLALDNPSLPMLFYTNLPGQPSAFVRVYGFDRINSVPFPSEDAPRTSPNRPYATLPYIGFDYLGRVISGKDEIIPLSKGSVGFSRGPDRKPLRMLPSLNEQPPGNATNNISYNLIYIDWLTGRARAIHQEVR